LNDSKEKVMSGCSTERGYQAEAEKAAKTDQAQESIGSPRDAILPKRERIAAGHKALGTHPISFRGCWVNVERVSPDDESGRVQRWGKAL
jgi:hypothetical protein